MPRGTGISQLLMKERRKLEKKIEAIDAVMKSVVVHRTVKRGKRVQTKVRTNRAPVRKPLGVRTRPKEQAEAVSA
jgi:hypothetical protein